MWPKSLANRFISSIRANDLWSMVVATSSIQLLVGFAFYFHFEPFRFLFKAPYYDPNPAPLEGLQNIVYAYWYTFVFGLTGLMVYLGRCWPNQKRVVLKAILTTWLATFFSILYVAARPLWEPNFPEMIYTNHEVLFFLWPVFLVVFFGSLFLIANAVVMKANESRPWDRKTAFGAVLAFSAGAIATPPIFGVTLLVLLAGLQSLVALVSGK